MTANELRIGNLVYLKNDFWHEYKNMPMLVTGISTDGNKVEMFPNSPWSLTIILLDKSYDITQMDKFIKPIPITDEWLLRLGFKPTDDYFMSKKLWTNTRLEISILHKRLIIWDNKQKTYTELKYLPNVHQLQNLYFALTGEELTIN